MRFKNPHGKVLRSVSRRAFVEFWSSRYRYTSEALYVDNIGKPLTANRIGRLFKWKNGRRLSARKRATVSTFRSDPWHGESGDVDAYLRRRGGPIWRIFWLHLQRPDEFPIFDQHVYRAMTLITGRGPMVISSRGEAKVTAYLRRYVPFFRTFRGFDQRRVDRALMMYGRFVAARTAARK